MGAATGSLSYHRQAGSAFAGEDCLAVYCPELHQCKELNSGVIAALAGDDPLAIFRGPSDAPVQTINDEDSHILDTDEEDQAPISLVYLLAQPRELSADDVRAGAERTLGVHFDVGDEKAQNFVIPMPVPQSYMMKVPQGIFLVNCFGIPYFDELAEVTAQPNDQRLQKVLPHIKPGSPWT